MATTTFIDLAPLNGNLRRLEVREPVALPPFNEIEFPQPFRVRLTVERVGGAIGVVGDAVGTLRAVCDRCLEAFETERRFSIDEQFALEGAGGDPYGEAAVVVDDRLDLSDLVRQVVDAALPISVLCREECRGLCGTCGADLNEGTCDCRLLLKGDHGES